MDIAYFRSRIKVSQHTLAEDLEIHADHMEKIGRKSAAAARAEAKAKQEAEARAKAEEAARRKAFEDRAAEAIRPGEGDDASGAVGHKPDVERAPLPAPNDAGTERRFDPNSIDTFLRSLEETQ